MKKRNWYKWRYCLKCRVEGKSKKETKITDYGKIVGTDRPYRNFWFHTDCYDSIVGNESALKKWENMGRFLQENREIWYNDK